MVGIGVGRLIAADDRLRREGFRDKAMERLEYPLTFRSLYAGPPSSLTSMIARLSILMVIFPLPTLCSIAFWTGIDDDAL